MSSLGLMGSTNCPNIGSLNLDLIRVYVAQDGRVEPGPDGQHQLPQRPGAQLVAAAAAATAAALHGRARPAPWLPRAGVVLAQPGAPLPQYRRVSCGQTHCLMCQKQKRARACDLSPTKRKSGCSRACTYVVRCVQTTSAPVETSSIRTASIDAPAPAQGAAGRHLLQVTYTPLSECLLVESSQHWCPTRRYVHRACSKFMVAWSESSIGEAAQLVCAIVGDGRRTSLHRPWPWPGIDI